MTMRRCLAAVLPVLSILSQQGCSSNGTTKPVVTQANADRAAIQGLIAAAPEFAVSFDDDGQLDGDATSPIAAPVSRNPARPTAPRSSPTHWGRWRIRRIIRPTVTVTFLEPPGHHACRCGGEREIRRLVLSWT